MNETKLSIGIAFYALRQFYDNILIDVIINTGCPSTELDCVYGSNILVEF